MMSSHAPSAPSPTGAPPPSPGGLPRAAPAGRTKVPKWIMYVALTFIGIVTLVISVMVIRGLVSDNKKSEQVAVQTQVAPATRTLPAYAPPQPQPVPQQQAPAAAPATILATRPALQCESPVTAPSVQSGLESEPVYIRPRFTILHDSTGPFRISSCHDLIEGWKQQAICPNGADYEKYQAVGNDPVQVCPKYVPMAQAPGLPIPGQ